MCPVFSQETEVQIAQDPATDYATGAPTQAAQEGPQEEEVGQEQGGGGCLRQGARSARQGGQGEKEREAQIVQHKEIEDVSVE